MSGKSCAGVVMAAVLWCAPLGAQETLTPLEAGARSLSFREFGGGGAIGYWKMRSEQLNVGWQLYAAGEHEDLEQSGAAGDEFGSSRTTASVGAGPVFRRYAAVNQRVIPFVETGLRLGYTFQRLGTESALNQDQALRTHGIDFGGHWGVGLEWFPAPRVSFAGMVGAAALAGYAAGGDGNVDVERWYVRASTFNSGFAFRLYLQPGSRLFP